MNSRIQTPARPDRKKSFAKCPYCGLSIFHKSWRDHMKEHDNMSAAHGSGGTEKEMDSLPVRIESLKKTILRLQSKPRKTAKDIALLHEYDDGMVQLLARLKRETT